MPRRGAASIIAVDARPLDVPMSQPFEIAGGSHAEVRNVLARLRLADGTVGYGEGAPMGSYNGETQALALREARAACAALVGRDSAAWRGLLEELERLLPRCGAARAALGTALLDAWTRHAGIPLRALFGGAQARLVTDITVSILGPKEARQAARRILARGIRTIKIKIGTDLESDEARIRAVNSAGPGLRLMLDANQGYGPKESLTLLRRLRRRGIVPVLFEQPAAADDYAGLRRVARLGGVPVAADESASSRDAVLRLVRERAAHVVNIKLTKCGLLEAWDIAGIARAAGLRLMIGGNIESDLAMTAAAHFAAGLGGFQFVDLDTPLWFSRNPMRGAGLRPDGLYDLSGIKAGIGVRPGSGLEI
ncbi:MAG TPA: dipeptide epimerase [Elusimicrobia bacterium]|nr:dipeptide epimerase [Elusimicrobiota bacterium]HBT61370.1 dipeptide epimerase [Elusimicrobiota bacterium]